MLIENTAILGSCAALLAVIMYCYLDGVESLFTLKFILKLILVVLPNAVLLITLYLYHNQKVEILVPLLIALLIIGVALAICAYRVGIKKRRNIQDRESQ